ncbi:MAG: NAD(+) synthase, partial [Candidatus Hydrogenedentota bacterium]
MRLVKIGVASVSVKVGDFAGNAARLREVVQAARGQDVHLLVTPELAVSGYSLEDRVFWPEIARRGWAALEELATATKGIAVFFGLPVCLDSMMYNGTALAYDGSVRGVVLKKYLPTYSIFYEGRNWTAWRRGVSKLHGVPIGDVVFKLPFGCVSAEICEDLWSTNQPAGERVLAGAEIICNSSASPFTPLKNEQRKRLVLGAAGSFACVYAYANLLGCDSSRLVFDGGGLVATPDGIVAEGSVLSKDYWTLAAGVVNLDDVGRVRAENSTWRQRVEHNRQPDGSLVVDLDEKRYTPAKAEEYAAQMPANLFLAAGSETSVGADAFLDQLFDALVLGLRDYFEKVGTFDRFLVALSGGRDSSLCLLLAVHAAKALDAGAAAADYARRVKVAYLPNKAYSSDATQAAARALAEELGVPFKVADISEEAKIAFEKAAELADGSENVTPIAKQNLQARIRGSMMLNWANNERGLLLVTSNLSEAAVGYTTTGGDNQGGYSPIANVPKTILTALLERIAARERIASIEHVLAIPPSAELAPDQTDEADLMPYGVLDDLLFLFARRRMSLTDCWRILVYRHPDHKPE